MARYVVRNGRLRKDEPFYPGTLVYYDERVFREGRAWLRCIPAWMHAMTWLASSPSTKSLMPR